VYLWDIYHALFVIELSRFLTKNVLFLLGQMTGRLSFLNYFLKYLICTRIQKFGIKILLFREQLVPYIFQRICIHQFHRDKIYCISILNWHAVCPLAIFGFIYLLILHKNSLPIISNNIRHVFVRPLIYLVNAGTMNR